MLRRSFIVLLGIMLVFGAVQASAQQYLLVANEKSNARAFQGQPGRRLTFICPADVAINADIWGTDVYADTSAICTAAAHAGRRTPGATWLGTILLGGRVTSFAATNRNGVSSLDYGHWDGSYTFTNDAEPGQIDWLTTAQHVPDDVTRPIPLLCPPRGDTAAPIWGTDVYMDDSAICVAAVHAGAIAAAEGGRITINWVTQLANYAASTRNGVSSAAWTVAEPQTTPRPFTVTPGAIDARRPVAADGSTERGRTIRLDGFTASGAAAAIEARTVRLTGFSGRGAAAAIEPRNIRLDGWNGTGTATSQ